MHVITLAHDYPHYRDCRDSDESWLSLQVELNEHIIYASVVTESDLVFAMELVLQSLSGNVLYQKWNIFSGVNPAWNNHLKYKTQIGILELEFSRYFICNSNFKHRLRFCFIETSDNSYNDTSCHAYIRIVLILYSVPICSIIVFYSYICKSPCFGRYYCVTNRLDF